MGSIERILDIMNICLLSGPLRGNDDVFFGIQGNSYLWRSSCNIRRCRDTDIKSNATVTIYIKHARIKRKSSNGGIRASSQMFEYV